MTLPAPLIGAPKGKVFRCMLPIAFDLSDFGLQKVGNGIAKR
tara:strand:+ start:40478 stop:40603 length:126 start_codon:yes stop_codon:yes gene_type:complete